jgi:predicted dehydrogenase
VSNTVSPPQGYSLRIIGEEGQILLAAPSYYQFSPVKVSVGPTQVSVGSAESGGLEEVDIPAEYFSDTPITEGHAAYNVARALGDFADSIREGRRFRPDFADGVDLHRIIDAVMISSREGRRVTV